MVKENIIQEVQELIQQIKNEYQEAIDFENLIIKDKKVKNYQSGCLKIISERLKNFLRRKFNFPVGVNDYLDYSKSYHPNHFFYRTDRDSEHDYLCLSIDGRSWEYFFPSQKDFEEWRKENPDNHWDSPEEKNPKNCSVCGKIVLLKEGWMKLWNDHCRIIGVNDDGYSMKLSKPFALAHFHPHCAKEYFSDKEQSNQNDNSRIKEKILQNLEKICLDPAGCLVNAELIKNWSFEEWCEILERGGSEELAKKGLYNIKDDNGEKIDLQAFFDWPDTQESVKKDYLKIARTIVFRVKDNPTDWEFIGKSEGEGWEMVRNKKTGLKHYNPLCITNPNFLVKEKKEIWNDIKSAINDPEFTDKNNKLDSSELENLKKIFREHDIREITFKNGNLVIDYYKKKPVNEQEFCELEKYCQENGKKLITSKSLGLGISNSNSQSNQNNHQLAIGLAVGGGIAAVILIGVVYSLASKKKNKL